jgi:hypothetical protein
MVCLADEAQSIALELTSDQHDSIAAEPDAVACDVRCPRASRTPVAMWCSPRGVSLRVASTGHQHRPFYCRRDSSRFKTHVSALPRHFSGCLEVPPPGATW